VTNSTLLIILSFRRDVNEICALLDFTQRRTVVWYGRYGRTYRSLEDGTVRLADKVRNSYHTMLYKFPEQRRSLNCTLFRRLHITF